MEKLGSLSEYLIFSKIRLYSNIYIMVCGLK